MHVDQASGALPIVGCQRVLHRFHDEPLPLEPGAGTAVQRRHRLRLAPLARRSRNTWAKR